LEGGYRKPPDSGWQNHRFKMKKKTAYCLLMACACLAQLNSALAESVLQTRSQQANAVIAQNNTIAVTEVFEQNEQAVNGIYLNTWAKGIFTFDSVQTVVLENIAVQCPLTGGSAVFRTTGAAAVIASNNSIAADSIYDENEKTLHDIYLKTVVKGLPLTLAQKAQVLSIAGQCPEVGGYSTYWARAWHSALTGVLIAPQGCEGVEERSQSEASIELKLPEAWLSIFPNPAQQNVTIEYSIPEDWEQPSLLVLNAIGNTVAEHHVDPALSIIKLPVGDLPNGIYFLQIASGKKKTGVQNLIIIR
jgi:hypothetical protein